MDGPTVMRACPPDPQDDLLARNERGQIVLVDVPWIVAVVADRAWDMTLLHLIDGQCLTVDRSYEEVAAIVRGVPVTMH
jgi:hypothetical protein